MTDEEEIIEHHRAAMLPELFIRRTKPPRDDELVKAFRETLRRLHNDKAIDALESARTISRRAINQNDFFRVMIFYCEIIPDLDAEIHDMLAVVKALVARGGEDLMAGRPNQAFRKWIEKDERARAALAEIKEDDPGDSTYLYLSLQALAQRYPDEALTRAITYLNGTAGPARSAAAKAIGTFALGTYEARNHAVDSLSAACSSADDNTLGHILTAACEILRTHNDNEIKTVAMIQNVTPQVGNFAIHQLSFELSHHGEELPPSILSSITAIMHKVAIGSSSTLENIDAASSKLISHDRLDEALALITPPIATHAELASLEAFQSFSYALHSLPPEKLSRVIINWLLTLDPNLGNAAQTLVGNHHDDAPLILQFECAAFTIGDADKVLLAHRAISYLFMHPITAASLVLEIVPHVAKHSRARLAEILFDPLLINYSGDLADWLRKRVPVASPDAKSVIIQILARLDAYINGLREAGWIKELRPSEREKMIESQRQIESMRLAHKQAEERSVLLSIVSRSVILYGTRSISYTACSNEQSNRTEMELHSFSHTIEAPRLDVLEPFELDYQLRTFRAMRSKKS